MKPALLFDLDGTLLDTLSDLRDSTNFALKKFGFEGKNTETIRNCVGNGLKKLIQRSLPNGASAIWPTVRASTSRLPRRLQKARRAAACISTCA